MLDEDIVLELLFLHTFPFLACLASGEDLSVDGRQDLGVGLAIVGRVRTCPRNLDALKGGARMLTETVWRPKKV